MPKCSAMPETYIVNRGRRAHLVTNPCNRNTPPANTQHMDSASLKLSTTPSGFVKLRAAKKATSDMSKSALPTNGVQYRLTFFGNEISVHSTSNLF